MIPQIFHFDTLYRISKLRGRALSKHLILSLLTILLFSCSPQKYRNEADQVASGIITEKQEKIFGTSSALEIDRPENLLRKKLLGVQNLPNSGPMSFGVNNLPTVPHWPEIKEATVQKNDPYSNRVNKKDESLKLTLIDALQVAAGNNRQYMTNKENVFLTALDLDLERNEFRNFFTGTVESEASTNTTGDKDVSGVETSGLASISRQLKRGGAIVGTLFIDLVNLVSANQGSSLGIAADASITIPLLLGAGEWVVTEPLTQAERDVVYALYDLEYYKSELAVQVTDAYLGVLNQKQQVKNAEDNYQRLRLSVIRARRLSDAGRISEIQVDQAIQDELRAEQRVIAARQQYAQLLDGLKVLLGLPTDALIDVSDAELVKLESAFGKDINFDGGQGLDSKLNDIVYDSDALRKFVAADKPNMTPLIEKALNSRMDFLVLKERVVDAQRQVVVAANALEAGLDIKGSARIGERRSLGLADEDNAEFRLDKAQYSAGFILDLPLERTAERNAFRESFVNLQKAVRDVQELEDQIKFDIRDDIRSLKLAIESLKIQKASIELAEKRVESTELFLEAGRAEIRDTLEAKESLLAAKNTYTSALVNYRIAELSVLRDMGVLKIDRNGLYSEAGKEQYNRE